MPPERKIEKLLRAYAKRRRTVAGDSFTLTPATRRRLQEEVARQRREQEKEEETSLSLWQLFRQQWAFFTAFALAIFLGAALILPMMTTSKSKSRSEGAYAAKSPAPAKTMPMTPPGASPAPAPAAFDDFTAQPGNPVMNAPSSPAANPSTDYLSPNLALDVPVTAGTHGLLYKKNETDVVAGTTFEPREKSSAGEFSFGGAGGGGGGTSDAVTVAHREIFADAIQTKLAPTNAIQIVPDSAFASAVTKDSKQGGSYQNVAASAKASRVLTRFHVTQNGSDIQIVDYDGSVYRGSWAPKVAQNSVNRSVMNGNNQVLEQNSAPPAGTAQPQIGGAYVQTASQVYSVRVSGDNRTLKQRVVFAGDLSVVLTANGLANNAAAVSGLAQNATGNGVSNAGQLENNQNGYGNGGSQQSLWLNSFIVGKATVAGTNQVEINAISVAP
jgi:hypothetical protein